MPSKDQVDQVRGGWKAPPEQCESCQANEVIVEYCIRHAEKLDIVDVQWNRFGKQ